MVCICVVYLESRLRAQPSEVPYDDYVEQCLAQSPLSRFLKDVYESIRANALIHRTLNNISLDVQLPPFLGALLRADPSDPSGSITLESYGFGFDDDDGEDTDDDQSAWGP